MNISHTSAPPDVYFTVTVGCWSVTKVLVKQRGHGDIFRAPCTGACCYPGGPAHPCYNVTVTLLDVGVACYTSPLHTSQTRGDVVQVPCGGSFYNLVQWCAWSEESSGKVRLQVSCDVVYTKRWVPAKGIINSSSIEVGSEVPHFR